MTMRDAVIPHSQLAPLVRQLLSDIRNRHVDAALGMLHLLVQAEPGPYGHGDLRLAHFYLEAGNYAEATRRVREAFPNV